MAVRVRPFNQREKDLKSKLCVKMRNNTTMIFDGNGKERSFTFDYSFWSHDGFKIGEDGMILSESKKFADQEHVYQKVGKQVLTNALGGYHCCLFAYGQTGSGKSYSMIGYGVNRGIVPIISEEIFKIASEKTSESKSFKIEFSMLEIYNEKVQDLMARIEDRPTSGLKIRQSKKHGVFVDKLSKHLVKSYEDIEEKMAHGNKNRTIAATQMNASSSRAHTIISIELTQKEIIYGNVTEKFSVINLVDLAGSEKVSKTGATGDRLKEGSSINKSLTVLGMVISALADIAMGKKGKVIPYRDSSLTRILQNALGGNSKTLMICAISPSNDNYDETLSTLRYADQAKKIKCHAKINESPKDKMIRELKEENEKLRKELSMKEGKVLPDDVNEENDLKMKLMEQGYVNEIEQLKKMLEEAQEKANKIEKEGTAEKFELKENSQEEEKQTQSILRKPTVSSVRNLSHAHLININEDPFLSGKIYKDIDKLEKISIGKRKVEADAVQPVIILASVDIDYDHAFVEKKNQDYYLFLNEGKSGGVYRNGVAVEERVKLQHLDRIIFGTAAVFLFKNPVELQKSMFELDIQEEDIDYEFCQMEMIQNGVKEREVEDFGNAKVEEDPFDYEEFKRINQEENEKRLREETKKITQEYEEKLRQLEDETTFLKERDQKTERVMQQEKNNIIQAYENMLKKMEEEFVENQVLAEEQSKARANRAGFRKMQETEAKAVNRKIATLNPNITELNLISRELGRNIEFSVRISYFFCELHEIDEYNRKKKKRIKIKVDNREKGYCYLWDLETFRNRYFIIKDHYFKSEEEQTDLVYTTLDEDPFYDPPRHFTEGRAIMKLMNLAYLMDYKDVLELVGPEGNFGSVEIELTPVDEDVQPYEDDHPIFDEFVDDTNMLIGKPFNFEVSINRVEFKMDDLKKPLIRYSIPFFEDGELVMKKFETEEGPSNVLDHDFKYLKVHRYEELTPELLDFFLDSKIEFKLQVFPEIEKAKEPLEPKKKKNFKKQKVNPIPQSLQVAQSEGSLPLKVMKKKPAYTTNREIQDHNKQILQRKKKNGVNGNKIKAADNRKSRRGQNSANFSKSQGMRKGKDGKDCRVF